MKKPERYDTRPRVAIYNQAVFDFLKATRGEAVAAREMHRLVEQQRRLGIEPRMRYPKDEHAEHMRGAPVIDLEAEARQLAISARNIEWFSRVGVRPKTNGEISHVDSWQAAVEGLLSRDWYNYTVDCMNAITTRVAASFPKSVYNVLWVEVVHTVDSIMQHDSLGRTLKSHLAAHVPSEKLDAVVAEVVLLSSMPCVEAHWGSYVELPARPFKRMLEWLREGRLPCRALAPYPAIDLVIY
jgi:hypothetical protein